MKYLNNKLQKNEKVVYVARLHWFMFFQPAVLLFLGYFFYLSETDMTCRLGVLLLFLGLVSLVQRVLVKIGTVCAVTNKRAILKTGVLSHNRQDLVLAKCEGIQVRQSLSGRILNYGKLIVTTGGAVNAYHYISDPFRYKAEIDRQIG